LSAVLDPGQTPKAELIAPEKHGWQIPMPAWEIALLAAIVVAAFALRLAWTFIADARPTQITSGDPFFYDSFGQFIARGQGMIRTTGEVTAQWTPGYPVILAVIFKLFGHSIFLVKLLNVTLGAATCLLVYAIGRKVFNRGVGLVAAAALALFPSQIYQPTMVMTETMATFLIAAFVCLIVFFAMDSMTWRRAVVVGAFIGVTTFVRGETILLALPLVIVWALAGRSLLAGVKYGAIALGVTALVISPWVLRNWVELGYPILVSTGSGENLISGHWDGADGEGSFVPVIETNQMYDGYGYPKKETLVYKEQVRSAVSFAVNNPRAELELIPKKVFKFYHADSKVLLWIEKGTLDNPAFTATEESHWRAIADVYYWVALAVAGLGAPFWLARRNPGRVLLLLIVAYYTFLFGFVFVGEQRFHSALIPLLTVFAAVSLVKPVELALAWFGSRPRTDALLPALASAPEVATSDEA
jgi:4-amino-4-deoxy-L-arabinose transferase-like glycosyltransferase